MFEKLIWRINAYHNCLKICCGFGYEQFLTVSGYPFPLPFFFRPLPLSPFHPPFFFPPFPPFPISPFFFSSPFSPLPISPSLFPSLLFPHPFSFPFSPSPLAHPRCVVSVFP